MTTTTDPAGRAEFFAAAREMLDWLEAHPEVPLPKYPHNAEISVVDRGSDEEGCAEVARVAILLGEPVEVMQSGSHIAKRVFGGRVQYQAAMVPSDEMARYGAHLTYAGSATP